MFNQYNKGSHVFDSKLTITKEEASHFLSLTADKAMDYIAAKGANCLTTNITGVGTSLFNVILHKNKNDIHLGLITKILDKYEKEISNIPMSELMPFMVDLLAQESYKSFAVIAERINLNLDYIEKETEKTLLHLFCESLNQTTFLSFGMRRVLQKDELRLLKLLINSNMHINAQDRHGNTALHFAAPTLIPDLILHLKYAGADISIKNLYGQTPLHFVATSKNIATTMVGSLDAYIKCIINKNKPSEEVIENISVGDLLYTNEITGKDITEQMHTKDQHGITPAAIFAKQMTLSNNSSANAWLQSLSGYKPFNSLLIDQDDSARILAKGRQDLSAALDKDSPISQAFTLYLTDMVDFITREFTNNKEKKNFRVIIGERHHAINCGIAELFIVCACHKIGIENILIELDRERWMQFRDTGAAISWSSIEPLKISMKEVAIFAEELGLENHMVDLAAKAAVSFEDEYKLPFRNYTMLREASLIDGSQVWIVGAEHLKGLLREGDVAINVTDFSRYDIQGKSCNKYINIQHPDIIRSLMTRQELLDMVRHCYSKINAETTSLRCKL